jgi:hypothetical protein
MCFIKFVYFCGVDTIDLVRVVYLFFAVLEAIMYEMEGGDIVNKTVESEDYCLLGCSAME